MSLIFELNEPNLNLLGKRKPHIYCYETLADVECDCRTLAAELRIALRFYPSNLEYEIIDWIHEARKVAGGIVINPRPSPIRRSPSSMRSTRSTRRCWICISPASTSARDSAITDLSRRGRTA